MRWSQNPSISLLWVIHNQTLGGSCNQALLEKYVVKTEQEAKHNKLSPLSLFNLFGFHRKITFVTIIFSSSHHIHPFYPFHTLLSTLIHFSMFNFHPCIHSYQFFIHFHPLSSICNNFIYFYPQSSILINFINCYPFHPFLSTTTSIHFHQLLYIFIHFHFSWVFDKTVLETCDIWDTDYNSDNGEPEFMTIFVTWQFAILAMFIWYRD